VKAIIISDVDTRALLDRLELALLRNEIDLGSEWKPTIQDMHRVFHFVVTNWLAEVSK
jgi:ethanolamine utilization cobalamin adenosyltransferase